MKRCAYLTLAIFAIGLNVPAFANPQFEVMLDELLEGSVPQITTVSLAAELNAAKQRPILLDTRPEEEYAVSHLAGALRIGFGDFSLDRLTDLDKTSPVIVYCSVGKRSELIGEKLLAAGFTNVRNLRGGIFQWANQGRSLVDADGATRKVHSYNRRWAKWLNAEVPSVR